MKNEDKGISEQGSTPPSVGPVTGTSATHSSYGPRPVQHRGTCLTLNPRSRIGIALIATAVLIFAWSIWLVSWTYDAFSTHCDTVDLWSKHGVASIVLMLIGTILFSTGTFLTVTSDREPDTEQAQRGQIR